MKNPSNVALFTVVRRTDEEPWKYWGYLGDTQVIKASSMEMLIQNARAYVPEGTLVLYNIIGSMSGCTGGASVIYESLEHSREAFKRI